jgi:glutathione S-transferase
MPDQLDSTKMMKLYGRRSSINVQKVLWCLGELGCEEGRDYERIDAGLQFGIVDTPEYLSLNPNGLVPTLIDGDFVLWESNSIVRYLAVGKPASGLLPVDPRGRADAERWMDWQLATLWVTLRVCFLGLTRTPEAERNYPAIKRSYTDASTLLMALDRTLARQAYSVGDRFSVADIPLGLAVQRWLMLAERFESHTGKRPDLEHLDAWFKRIEARPAFQAAII